jgi:F-type H+-transporting ATPase subunit delta
MSTIAVARRYAEALADVALARDQVEQVGREVHIFSQMMESNRELRDLFASPILPVTDKRRVLKALLDRSRPAEITTNLLRTMLNRHRLHLLPEVYEQFRREINERKGLIVAEVTTSTEVGRSEQQKLGRTLQQMTGKQVEFQFKTDPSLIGGVVTRIGSVVYDGSVKTQLLEIKERLKKGEST